LYTVFVWWFTTGAIIYLDGLPRRTFKVSMAVATLVLGVAVYGLSVTAADTSVTGAYLAFTFALLAWGWNEMGFLMGVVTGPRDTACPEGAEGLQRLGYAVQSVLYHEVVIAVTALVIFAVTAGEPNQVGLITFGVLWAMRLSAKVNVYLGVPNITEEFLPPHLVYLKSYFRTRAMNAVFPVSITLITLCVAYFGQLAGQSGASPFDVTAYSLLATLSALALIEHWFMVLPIPSAALWQWGLTSHAAHAAPVLARTVIAPATARVTAFAEATTGAAEPQMAASGSTIATIVPFPIPTPVTHRRRP
jgi:putative photosynthetic complex assembly protein 2